MRIDKFLSDGAGITRSEARSKIRNGLVKLNGEIIRNISQHVSEVSEVFLEDKKIIYRKYVYIMMNKPKGVISATEDKSKKTVIDIIDSSYSRFGLFPVGRLDIDTEGFLLLTNDGSLSHKLLSPSKKFGKTYYVKLNSEISDADIEKLRNGVDIGDIVTKKADVKKLSENEIELTITEGKFHQIKRMAEKVSNKVIYLKRLAYGSLFLDSSLIPGEYRELTESELMVLKQDE